MLRKYLCLLLLSGTFCMEAEETQFLYDIDKTYDENCKNGPLFQGEIPNRDLPSKDEWVDFLGVKVMSRLGIPAGPLLNSKWVKLGFDSGADICIYKTIRAEPRAVNGFPNVVYIDVDKMFDPKNPPKVLQTLDHSPIDRSKTAITNSFGMPSKDATYLKKDIQTALNLAREGQVLIVSVVGTNIESFVQAALLAKESGVKVIEANFSCPNVTAEEGQLYLDPQAVKTVTKAIVQTIGEIPLILKVGRFPSKERLCEVFMAAEEAGAAAISGINTVPAEVRKKDQTPALDENRKTSGICGYPIRATALNFAKDAREVISENDLQLKLIVGGGITQWQNFYDFLQYADFVMCGTGWFADPYIFTQWHENH